MFKVNFLPRTSSVTKGAPEKDEESKLLVGLGNPGDQYRKTFHNVGLMFVDFLAKETGQVTQKYRSFEFFKIDHMVVVKPIEFMNQSGVPIKKALRHFGLKAANLVVVHDDSDLSLGQYKTSRGQGSAGHKGIESIFKELGTNEFDRIRIGIRKEANDPRVLRRKAGDFVLKQLSQNDERVLGRVFLEIKVSYLKA